MGAYGLAIHAINDQFILISDTDKMGVSITNSAEAVVRHIDRYLDGIGKRRIIYRDSMGRFDELRHTQGQFDGFAPCSSQQQVFFAEILENVYRPIEINGSNFPM